MSFVDMLLIPAMLGPLITGAIMGFAGHGWYYFLTVLGFDLWWGLMEFLSVKTRGKSISKDIAETRPGLFWAVIGTWTMMHIALTVHWWMMR